MNMLLFNTRGRRPFQYTLVLIPGKVEPGKPARFKCNSINDPLANVTRLGAVEIVIAGEGDEEKLQDFQKRADMNGFMTWLGPEPLAKASAEPAPAAAAPAPPAEPETEEEEHPKHKQHSHAEQATRSAKPKTTGKKYA